MREKLKRKGPGTEAGSSGVRKVDAASNECQRGICMREIVTKERRGSMRIWCVRLGKCYNERGGTLSRLISGTKSFNVALWNQAMKVVGVPEAKWTEIRGKLMRVLLDEHDNILRSCQAQTQ